MASPVHPTRVGDLIAEVAVQLFARYGAGCLATTYQIGVGRWNSEFHASGADHQQVPT
jgi:hypothetical protein